MRALQQSFHSCFFRKMGKPGGMAQVVESLPSKCEALSSNSSTAQKDEEM
jgi:hypothetical protein